MIAAEGLDVGGRPGWRAPRPDLDFARALAVLAPEAPPAPGIHPTAVIAPDAEVDPRASVGPHVFVGARSRVGAGTELHASCALYEDVRVGADCVVRVGAVLRERVELGDRVRVDSGAVIGSEGFGFTYDEQGHPLPIPQLGRVVIEDDVQIGALTSVQRAALDETRIRRNAKIDNLCTIAHNCDIGEDVVIVGQAGIAGSTTIERGAILMGQAATRGHLTIGAGAFVAARSGVHGDVPPGTQVGGFPHQPRREWQRAMAALVRLPEALRRLRAVERKLGLRRPGESGE